MLQSVALEMKHGSQSFTLFYKVSVKKVSLTLSVCEIPKFGSSVTDCFFFFFLNSAADVYDLFSA